MGFYLERVILTNTIGQVDLGESLTARTEALCTWLFGLVHSLVYFNLRCLDAFLFAASFRELGPVKSSGRQVAREVQYPDDTLYSLFTFSFPFAVWLVSLRFWS